MARAALTGVPLGWLGRQRSSEGTAVVELAEEIRGRERDQLVEAFTEAANAVLKSQEGVMKSINNLARSLGGR